MPTRVKVNGLGLDQALDWIDVDGKPNISKLAIIAGAKTDVEISRLEKGFQSPAVVAIREVIRKLYLASQASPPALTDPNWPVQVAWQEGYLKALEELYKTIPVRSLDRVDPPDPVIT